jgi:hypothetical protein
MTTQYEANDGGLFLIGLPALFVVDYERWKIKANQRL